MPVIGTVFQKSRILQLSFPSHRSIPSLSPESGWLGRSPQPPQLCCCLLQSDLLSLQTTWLLFSYSRLHSFSPHTPDLLSHGPPSCKCSAHNFLCDSLSGPSYECHFCPVPVYFTFFCLPSLVKAKVPNNVRTSREGICSLPLAPVPYPSYVMSPRAFSVTNTTHPGWLPSSLQECMAINLPWFAMYLRKHIIHFPLPPNKEGGCCFPSFRAPMFCTLLHMC